MSTVETLHDAAAQMRRERGAHSIWRAVAALLDTTAEHVDANPDEAGCECHRAALAVARAYRDNPPGVDHA